MDKKLEQRIGVVDTIIIVVAGGMAIYHMISTQVLLWSPSSHQNLHLMLAFILVFLADLRDKHKFYPISLAFLFLSILGTGYVGVFIKDLELRIAVPTVWDIVFGATIIIAVLEASRRAFGLVLPLLTVISIAYAFWGSHLPGFLKAYQIGPTEIIYYISTGLEGVYGSLLGISANYIFLFILFGGILQGFGITSLFRELGTLLGRLSRSGPALVSVIGSSIVGMVTMSPSANIAITGIYSIPTMKRAGYKPVQAAAIEAASSTGGQIMPPVMSSAAFVMASITGISYLRIMIAAIIPALLYYFSLAIYAHLQALKIEARISEEEINVRELLWGSRLIIVPVGVILVLLIMRFTPMYAIFWAILSVIGVGLARFKSLPNLKEWLRRFSEGAITGARVAVALAAMGIIMKILTLSGLGLKLPVIVEALSGGKVLIALVLVMIATIIMGMGVPTVAAYLLVAMVTAPVLTKTFNLPLLQAHFFVFYFAVMSMLTPPVAPAALVSSAIAGTKFLETAIEQVKPTIPGFLAPFTFFAIPLVLLERSSHLGSDLLGLSGFLVALFSIQTGFVGYFLGFLSTVVRTFLIFLGLLIVAGIILKEPWLCVLPLIAVLAFYLLELKRKR